LRPAGETTLRRRKKRGGVEGDETFYLANEARVRGKDNIDLRVDPPPDLAIEAVSSHAAARAVEVYRRFGVPEVWVCDEKGCASWSCRRTAGISKGNRARRSPFLTAAESLRLAQRPPDGSPRTRNG
jgi:Uma2 family endonuclease